jgi:hypothetical protein
VAYHFNNTAAPTYQPGALFLGLDGSREIGIRTDRHALTIAGARSGKGAALLIPNARRWPDNLLCIDPKGEAVANSYRQRQELGQAVRVLDPFMDAQIPAELRASFNPLAEIDPHGFTSREDVKVIADGMVKRSNPQHAEWDEGAAELLAGIIAYVLESAPPEHRTLTSVRRVLLQPNEELYEDAQRMTECTGCGSLAKAAGVAIMTAVTADKGMEKDFLSGARRHSKWIDSQPIQTALSHSTFSLADLKTKHCSIYVVLPPHYIQEHAPFLRLFVRCAINAMAKGGTAGRRCLFLLDEFHALGRVEQIATAAGAMPGYGVHLWPFLQDLGQLQDLYNDKGSQTFFANADIHAFFGNADILTLSYVSTALGTLTPAEVAAGPPDQNHVKTWAGIDFATGAETPVSDYDRHRKELAEIDFQNQMRQHQHRMSDVGRPRLQPDEIKDLVAKRDSDVVSRSMIVFGKGRDVFNLALQPYFVSDARSLENADDTAAVTSSEIFVPTDSFQNMSEEEAAVFAKNYTSKRLENKTAVARAKVLYWMFICVRSVSGVLSIWFIIRGQYLLATSSALIALGAHKLLPIHHEVILEDEDDEHWEQYFLNKSRGENFWKKRSEYWKRHVERTKK